MNNSKLTSKLQVTELQEAQALLKLKIKKDISDDIAYLNSLESTLTEWDSKNDEEDFEVF
jgi:hypothetical protein